MQDAKQQLRASAAETRKRAFAMLGPEAGRLLASHGLDFLRVPAGAIVSGFAAIRDEINPAELMTWLHEEGFRMALPVMVGKGQPLVMRTWQPGDVLEPAAWGIAEPSLDKPEVVPQIVLVPLLAFDLRGFRLGYGGGYYDRTVALFRREGVIQAIGVAFAGQETDATPVGGTDAPLDWIVTEKEAFRCRT